MSCAGLEAPCHSSAELSQNYRFRTPVPENELVCRNVEGEIWWYDREVPSNQVRVVKDS